MWRPRDRYIRPCRCAAHKNVAKILSASGCQASRVYCLKTDMTPISCCDTEGVHVWQALRRFKLGRPLRDCPLSGGGSAGLDASHCSRGEFRTNGETEQVRPFRSSVNQARQLISRHMAEALLWPCVHDLPI